MQRKLALVSMALVALPLRAQSARQPVRADTVYDVVIRHGRILDGEGTLDSWRYRYSRRAFRKDRNRAADRTQRNRRRRQIRLARLDRHDGPVRRRAPAKRARRKQTAGRRHDGDRRRRRHARSCGSRPRVFHVARTAGHQHQFRQLLQRNSCGEGRGAWTFRARADYRGTRADACHHGHRDARWRHGDDDGADLSAFELQ